MTAPDRSPRRRTTRRQKRIFAICFGLLPFVLLEAGLRFAGVGAETDDVHAGFGRHSALFERRNDQLQTRVPKEQFFVRQQFPAVKPKQEFRIFCLGGSTVQGRPYRPETSFGAWLQLELNAIDSSRTYRVVNCGGVSYASYRLVPVLREVLDYQPDLIIVATGHNEFLEDRTYASMKSRSDVRLWLENQSSRLRTVTVARQIFGHNAKLAPPDGQPVSGDVVQARLDADEGYAAYERDDVWHQQVQQQFSDSIACMITECRHQQVPLLLMELGANLRDCPPFKSAHRNQLTVDEEQRWQRLFDRATQLENSDAQQAFDIYQQAKEIDDRYALLHFRIARCLDRLGRLAEARVFYQRAVDEDICPLRLTSALAERLRQAVEQHEVQFVDAATAIQAGGETAICGFESYIDHVHPAISTHQLMARQIVKHLLNTKRVSGSDLPTDVRRRLYRRYFDQLPETYFSNGRRRIGWVEGWARRQRLAQEIEPVNGAGFFRAALRSLDLHDYDRATNQLLMAMATDPDLAAQTLDQVVRLAADGRGEDAAWLLSQISLSALSDPLKNRFDLLQLLIAGSSSDSAQQSELLAQRSDWPDLYAEAPERWKQIWSSADLPALLPAAAPRSASEPPAKP